jgi:hypothetical protein
MSNDSDEIVSLPSALVRIATSLIEAHPEVIPMTVNRIKEHLELILDRYNIKTRTEEQLQIHFDYHTDEVILNYLIYPADSDYSLMP